VPTFEAPAVGAADALVEVDTAGPAVVVHNLGADQVVVMSDLRLSDIVMWMAETHVRRI
jgi:hypothetical protein